MSKKITYYKIVKNKVEPYRTRILFEDLPESVFLNKKDAELSLKVKVKTSKKAVKTSKKAVVASPRYKITQLSVRISIGAKSYEVKKSDKIYQEIIDLLMSKKHELLKNKLK